MKTTTVTIHDFITWFNDGLDDQQIAEELQHIPLSGVVSLIRHMADCYTQLIYADRENSRKETV